MAVADQLPGLGAGEREAEAMDDVVQPPLEQRRQVLPRVALAALGSGEIAAELPLEHSVVVLHFLLLAQVQPIIGQLPAARLILPGRNIAALDRAFRGVATSALEKELQPV